MVFLEVSLASQEGEELFTCEFLLLKLNLVNCMSSPQELGYDLSDKVSNIQAQITTNDQQIKNDLEAEITELETKLVAEIDSDVAAHQVVTSAANAALETKIDDLDTKMVDKIDTDVADMKTILEAQITALDTKLVEEIDSDIAALETKMDALDTKMVARGCHEKK